MNTLLIYFLKVNFAFVALYLFYRLCLQRDTFFREKRFALLLGYLFAVLHPLIDISAWIQQSQPATSFVQTLSNTLPEIVVTDRSTPILDFRGWALMGYAAVVIFLLLRMLVQTGSVLMLALHHPHEIRSGRKIVRLSDGTSPFSFYGMIFLNPDPYSEKDLEEILHHESAHVRQLHTLDVLLAEIIGALFWINPFVWLLNRCLRENLEFLADRDVLHKGFDPKSYQYHLLRLTYQATPVRMANHFNVSELKNRIVMMNKKKTSLAGLAKYTLSLPLFAFLLLSAYAWSANHEVLDLSALETTSAVTAKTPKADKKAQEDKKTTGTSNVLNEIVVTTNGGAATPEINAIDPENQATSTTSDKTHTSSTFSYSDVEAKPVFPGGESSLLKYLIDNIHYPAVPDAKKRAGRVTILFTVSETGKIVSPKVIRGMGSPYDEEALRVVKAMPDWTPGQIKGKNVSVNYVLPVVFRLDSHSKLTLDHTGSEPPLLIIDGLEKPYLYLSDTAKIRPDDIKAIDILKDTVAVRIYGEKGRNGVMVITTKKK
jgi:TonB family protein